MTNLQSPTTHKLSSTPIHPFGKGGWAPGTAAATAVRKETDLVQRLRENLARFRAYAEHLGQTPQVVSVSFQCLVDNQNHEVAEVLGVVAL